MKLLWSSSRRAIRAVKGRYKGSAEFDPIPRRTCGSRCPAGKHSFLAYNSNSALCRKRYSRISAPPSTRSSNACGRTAPFWPPSFAAACPTTPSGKNRTSIWCWSPSTTRRRKTATLPSTPTASTYTLSSYRGRSFGRPWRARSAIRSCIRSWPRAGCSTLTTRPSPRSAPPSTGSASGTTKPSSSRRPPRLCPRSTRLISGSSPAATWSTPRSGCFTRRIRSRESRC